MSSPFLVDVVLPLALPGAFTYALPETWQARSLWAAVW